jgi:hypothetical protein
MAEVWRVDVDPQGLTDLINNNPEIHALLMDTAKAVADEAQSTASAAEKGAGGRIDGYAAAGFRVEYEQRGGKRPRVNIISNADGMTAFRAHMYTQIQNGVGHLRAALYKFTTRG